VKSAHDCSDGGLAVALAESTFEKGLGAEICLPSPTANGQPSRADILLFNEASARAVLTVAPGDVDAALAHFQKAGIEALHLGTVQGSSLIFHTGTGTLTYEVATLRDIYEQAIPKLMEA
jgi:phosphoribosylformylglycinamidine synthase